MRASSFLVAVVIVAAWLPAQVLPTLKLETAADRESYRHMVRVLDGTVLDLEWKDAALKDVVWEIGRRTSLNVLVDRALADRAEETVTLTLKEIRARALLKVLEEQFKIAFQHRHGVLVATTPEDVLKRSMVLAIYDIRDVLYVPPDFHAPVLGINPGRPVDPEPQEEIREAQDAAFFVDLIRQSTGQETWEVEGASITADKGLLIVRHAPHVQAKVRRLVAMLRGL